MDIKEAKKLAEQGVQRFHGNGKVTPAPRQVAHTNGQLVTSPAKRWGSNGKPPTQKGG